jgi:hypothetical protein
MALFPCPECAANISEHAAACPHCGYPVASPPAGAGAPPAEGAAPDDGLPPEGEEVVPISEDPTRPYWQTAPPPPGAPSDEEAEGEEAEAEAPITDPALIGENLQRLLPAVFGAFLIAVMAYKGCEPPPPDPDAPVVIQGNSRVAETP